MFNKATNECWHDVLTLGDLAPYEAKVRQTSSSPLAAWIEGGRLGAGDPASTDE
jgi:hypothetical protein